MSCRLQSTALSLDFSGLCFFHCREGVLAGKGIVYDQGRGLGGELKRTSFGGRRVVAMVEDILRNVEERNVEVRNMNACIIIETALDCGEDYDQSPGLGIRRARPKHCTRLLVWR